MRVACNVLSYFFVILALPSGLGSQEPAADVTITVHPAALSDSLQAVVISALAALVEPVDWPKIVIEPNASLHAIIADRYRFTDRHPAVRDALTTLIVGANGLQNMHSLRAGDSLRVPLIPVRPLDRGADSASVQLVLVDSGSVGRVSADSAAFPVSTGNPTYLRGAATWAVHSSAIAYSRFESALPDSLPPDVWADALFVFAPGEYDVLSLPQVGSSSSEKPWTLPPGPAIAARLDPAIAGRLYLFDFFEQKYSDGRSHGAMVEDVARVALTAYGAPQLSANIVRVELDFWDRSGRPRASAIQEIEQYLSTVPTGTRRLRGEELGRLRRSRRYATWAVPGLYLEALYANRIRGGHPAIISSSFWGQIEGRILPREDFANSPVILVSAVLDDDILVIEDFQFQEPQRTFWELAPRYGTMLVGAAVNERETLGTISRTGSGVTVVGRGEGWSGAVIRPRDRGTSFATPSIAAALLVAQAFDRANGRTPSALEMSRRLALAADIAPAFVGRYASGGIPRIDRMLLPSGPYGVLPDGNVVPIARISGDISVRIGGGLKTLEFPVLGDEDPSLLGIAISTGQTYAYLPRKRMWSPVDVVRVSLEIEENGVTRTFGSLEALATRYLEIIVL